MRALVRVLFSVVAWAGIALATAAWTLVIAALFAAHRWLDPRRERIHRLASLWGRTLMHLAPGCRVALKGLDRLPGKGAVILMSNHQSYSDVPALFFLPAQFKWLADVDLFRIPVFGWSMRMAGYIPVRRGDPRQGLRSLERAKRTLAQGISVLIFPEGTRSHTGVFGRFQTGGFRLAAQAHVPIVPVVVSGTRQLLRRGSWVFQMGSRVQIEVLPAIPPPRDLRSVHEMARRVRAEMAVVYRRNLRSC